MFEIGLSIAARMAAAFAVGFVTAWLLRGLTLRREAARTAQLQGELDAMIARTAAQTKAFEEVRSDLTARDSRFAEVSSKLSEVEVQLRELQAFDVHHRQKIDSLFADLASRSSQLSIAQAELKRLGHDDDN